MLVMVGLFSVTQVNAEAVYRPYATCTSPNQRTNIEVMQNTDAKDVSNPFVVSVERMIRGNQISFKNQNALRIPIQRKDVLELFQSHGNKDNYFFELLITNHEPVNMMGQFRATFVDMLGGSVVYCSYHVTLGN